MSTKMEENSSHIEFVDVDSSVKETGSVSEITCDSGLGSICLDSVPLSTSLESTVSPKKLAENVLLEETASASKDHEFLASQSPTSISPDINDATENLLSLDDFSLSKTEAKVNENEHVSTNNYEMDLDELLAEIPVSNSGVSTNSSITDSTNDLQSNDLDLGDLKIICDYKTQSDLEMNNQMFRTSTVSLNEQKTLNDKITSISKSPYSRSAENISTVDQNVDASLNSSTKDLNAEKILSEFSSQKSKVSATHKIASETPQEQKTVETHPNLDVRYTRLPKELLPQDLGSIVKNVHGIFSSVSGSLKYAYNHTHRATVPKPKIIKTINGKVMDDIFEDNQQLATPENDKQITTEVAEDISDNECKYVDNDARRDIQRLQIESLERVLAEQRKENASMRERVKQQVDEMQEKDQTFKELEVKVDLMSKRVEQAEREKDAAVMRYASVECAAIEAKRAAEKAAVAERAAVAELELINNKLKSAHSEKQRICQLYDDKCHELQNNERSLAKAIEQQRELEGRLKWTQSKLRMEMDAYKSDSIFPMQESSERAEKLSQQISELEAAKDAAAANATDSLRAKQLEADLKESQAALILCRHEKEELERRLSTTTLALDVCKRERDTATSALTLTTAEVSRLKESNERLEQEAAELAALRAQAALADTLSAQLQRESTRAAQAEEELSKERARAETCAKREAAALEHAASLTASHVARRADDTERDAKTQALSVDNASLRERVAALEVELSQLQATLADETERRHKENKVLARKVAELTEEAADANKKLEWEKGENLVLKKKHSSAIKELNRELQRTLKRCEQLEAKLPPPDAASTRTGSISSLSSGESAPQEDRLHNGHTHGDALPDIQVREPDRQALIERIVSLQRAAARRAERCEFLEEHSKQLTGELRAKCKLLRHLLCSLPAGAVASTDSDQHKKEIARLGGGAMAAVWGGDPAGMTLELSLEMNKRLQAVLEDSLLKNITLKENMDTLGEEIARLKEKKEAPDTK